MEPDVRDRCLMHLREAALCLEGTVYGVTMVRLLDIVDEIEQDVVTAEASGVDS